MNASFSALHQLMGQMQKAFEDLGVKTSPHALESLSSTVFQVLTARERHYHTVRSRSEPALLKDPIWILASTFKDVVYLQIDKRVHPLIRSALEGFVIDENLSVVVPAFQAENMPFYLKLAMSIFGVPPGKKLRFSAEENKFLSAVVAAYFLCDLLETWDLFRVLVCIKVTTPILGISHFESDHAVGWLDKLDTVQSEFQLKKTKDDLKSLAALAVEVANHDRMMFVAQPEVFLSRVLSLMLETHPVLRNPACSVRQMRMSFQQYYEYLRSIKSHQIFQKFGGRPHDIEFARLKKKADQNLEIALQVFQSMVVSLVMLESLSMMTGGDAPYLLFIGDLGVFDSFIAPDPAAGVDQKRMLIATLSGRVYELLHQGSGRVSASLKNSFALGSYIHAQMSDSEIHQALVLMSQYQKGDLSALDFLASAYPEAIMGDLLLVFSQIAGTRSSQIREVLKELQLRAGSSSISKAA
jgi:hypothetical protein